MTQNGEEGINNEKNSTFASQFKDWLAKTNENYRIIKSKRKQILHFKKTKEQIQIVQNYVIKAGSGLFSRITKNPITEIITDSVIILHKSTQHILKSAEIFVNQLVDPLIGSSVSQKARHEESKPTQYHLLLDEAREGLYFDDEKWCLLISLLARNLEILLNQVLQQEEQKNLFSLLEISQEQNLLDIEQLDVLHIFRAIRNDLLHGRSNEINPIVIFATAEIIAEIEYYGIRNNLLK